MTVEVTPLATAVAMEIEGLVAPIKEKREALVTQEVELKAKLSEIQTGIRTYDRMLSVAQPQAPKPKPKARGESRFSQESLDELFGKLKEQFGNDPFTVSKAVDTTGLPKSRIYPSTKTLRDQGRLLKVGVDKDNRNATLFQVAPEGE